MISIDKDYKKLFVRLPLVPIESDTHLAKAHAIIVELAGKEKMTRGESQYFDVLSKLTDDYEKDIFPGEQMTPQEAFAYILEESGLSQGQMGNILGCRQGRISEILAGTRELSKEQIARLSNHFKVSANLFLSTGRKKAA